MIFSLKLNALRIAWERFLAWLLPFPDVKVTLNTYPTSFNTKVGYYYTGLDFCSDGWVDIIRIHTVELNLFIPGDRVPDDGILDVMSQGVGSYLVSLIDFVLYGLKWESTLQAVTRCIGFNEARALDKWVMDGDYKAVTGEAFPFFVVPKAILPMGKTALKL